MNLVLRSIYAGLVLSVSTLLPASAAIVIQDGDFQAGQWSTTIFSVNSGGGSSATVANQGNPDAYLGINISLGNAPSGQRSVAAVLLFKEDFLYNPATQGGVTSLGISLDLRRTVAASGAVGWGIAVRQGGELFVSGSTYFHTAVWQPLVLIGLTATDFIRLDSSDVINGEDLSSHPDFSATAAPFEIGFYARNSTTLGGAGYSRSYGFDNVVITIVPEPSVSLLLLGFGTFGLAFRRRRSLA